jgi:streptogramin lyase
MLTGNVLKPAAVLFLILPALRGQQMGIGAYSVPTYFSTPIAIAAGSDGALWFTESTGCKIGRITTPGYINEYALTDVGCSYWITAGPDGALWFTADGIARIATDGTLTPYPAAAVLEPAQIATGPDGALWFTGTKAIGRITTAGAVSSYTVPTANYGASGIVSGPDGALWFTEFSANKIGRMTTAGAVTEYAVPTSDSGPIEIASGPDGALWFTEFNGNKIGRISTGGVIGEYAVPTANSQPWGITVGPDGALWFTESNLYSGFYSNIGRITTSGSITEYPVPVHNARPIGITAGPDGEIWFVDSNENKVGEGFFQTASLGLNPATGSFGTSLSFNGSGFAAGETVRIYARGVGSNVLVSATADSTGALAATGGEPQAPYGPRLFVATGQTSGKLGTATVSVAPQIRVNPPSGKAGDFVVAQGNGFGSMQQVEFYWDDTSDGLGYRPADVNGTVSGDNAFGFAIPKGSTPGTHTLLADGPLSGVYAEVTFVVK